ncbi:MAG: hypothetical protein K2N23_05725 [Clostridia bacterium]|nr:hypothetical protein [Clostridia bacterium]
MTTQQIMDRLLSFIQELTAFYSELSQELPNLRVVVDNTRAFSELKKMPKRLFLLSARRRFQKKNYFTKLTVKFQLHLSKKVKTLFLSNFKILRR